MATLAESEQFRRRRICQSATATVQNVSGEEQVHTEGLHYNEVRRVLDCVDWIGRILSRAYLIVPVVLWGRLTGATFKLYSASLPFHVHIPSVQVSRDSAPVVQQLSQAAASLVPFLLFVVGMGTAALFFLLAVDLLFPWMRFGRPERRSMRVVLALAVLPISAFTLFETSAQFADSSETARATGRGILSNAVLIIIVLSLFVYVIIGASRHPPPERVFVAVCLIASVLAIFASLVWSLSQTHPGMYIAHLQGTTTRCRLAKPQAAYFVVLSFTTLGTSDIQVVTDGARTLLLVQSVVGFVVTALGVGVLLGRLGKAPLPGLHWFAEKLKAEIQKVGDERASRAGGESTSHS